MNIPTIEEAAKDLNDIRAELSSMNLIKEQAEYLASRPDVNCTYYRQLYIHVASDILRGEGVEKNILKHYPTLI